MDHLQLPLHPIDHRSHIVEYLVTGDDGPYDGGDFFTYPVRAGWEALNVDDLTPFLFARQNGRATAVASGESHEPQDRELKGLLQAWLYFGVLHLILHPAGSYDANHFIAKNERGRYVNTKTLPDKLAAWVEVAKTWDGVKKENFQANVKKAFTIASSAIAWSVTCIAASEAQLSPTDRTFLRSFAALYEYFALAYNEAFNQKAGESLFWQCGALKTLDQSERRIMIQHGWCPFDIALAEKDFQSTIILFYILHLRKSHGTIHDHCDMTQCKRTQIDLKSYRPQHVDESCTCEFIEADAKGISQCLQNGTYPVFRVSGNIDELVIDVRGYEDVRGNRPNLPYVALSHVWADGLGNPQATALPACQLLRMQRFANDIASQTYESQRNVGQVDANAALKQEERPLFLWCDTICCPPAPPGCTNQERSDKILALDRLRDVYYKAEHVLVLERDLTEFSARDIGYLESGMRLCTSAWMRRLWTLQEGALAAKVLIKFKEQRPLDLSDVRKYLHDINLSGGFRENTVAPMVSIRLTGLRCYFHMASPLIPNTINMVIGAMTHRRVTVPSDEALCLSAMFEIDRKRVAETAADLRMSEVWSLVAQTASGVPDTIVFNPLPRIQRDGLRWAPATVLTHVSDEPPDLARPYDLHPKPGRSIPLGLGISRPVWRIQYEKLPRGLNSAHEPLSMRSNIILRDLQGQWYVVQVSAGILPNHMDLISPNVIAEDKSRDLFILRDWTGPMFEQHGRTNAAGRALIGTVTSNALGLNVFHTIARGWVIQMSPFIASSLETSRRVAQKVRQKWAIFSLGYLARCRVTMDKVASWTPIYVRRLVRRLLLPLQLLLFQRLEARVVKDIRTACRAMLKHPQAGKEIFYRDMAQRPAMVEGDAARNLGGKTARVVEEFPVHQEWIVD